MDNNIEVISKLLEFVEQKQEFYTETELSYIIHSIKSKSFPTSYLEEGIREVFDVVGALPYEQNIYDAYTEYILSLYDVENKNIVEVGGGVFSRLAKRLSFHQNNGTVTVYDPRLDPSVKSEGLILRKELFTLDTNVKNVDLLVGLMPCKGAEPLLNKALKNDKDFILWLCEGGPHGDYFDYFEDEDEWLNSIVYYTGRELEDKGKELKIKKMERFSPYPIITNV